MVRKKLIFIFCVTSAAILLDEIKCDFPNQKSENIQIKVNSGVLQGKSKYLENGKQYFSFQKIPFALPPVGDLRFRDPVPFKKWKGILNATSPSYGCVELNLMQTTFKVFGDEDCLYLNVFTPENPNKIRKQLPVMVWILGGSFREGNSTIYGPEYLLKDNVIIVTFNYRLGIFGFLSTSDTNSPGNYGLKDSVLALKWVKDNIGYFGGNASKVTVFGESAGAAAIGYLLMSPQSKDLFHFAIMQSGSPLCSWSFQRNPRKIAFEFGISRGITTNSSKTLMTYLRNADLSKADKSFITVELLNFSESFQQGGTSSPSLEPNYGNAFLTKHSLRAFQNGDFMKVPIVMGINSQESKFFASLLRTSKPLFFLFDISPSSLVRPAMNIKYTSDQRIVANKIKSRYFKSGSFISGTDEEYAEFFSDDQFIRPITKTAKLLSRYVPVYFYLYDYGGSLEKWWLNYKSFNNKKVKGVAHATELWYLWRINFDPHEFQNDIERLVSKRLVRLWTNFAKFGNPTPYREGLLKNLIWPNVSENEVTYLRIGSDLRINKNFKNGSIAFWDNLYKTYSKGPYETY